MDILRRMLLAVGCMAFAGACGSNGGGNESASPTPTANASATHTATSSATPTLTDTPTPTATRSLTPPATATEPASDTPTQTPTPTVTLTPTTTDTPTPLGPVGGERPVQVFVPSSYTADVPMPLVILIHSFTITGAIAEASFQLRPVAEERGFLYAIPEGTKDQRGSPFWNATSGCCDFYRSGVDDSGYLRRVIEDIEARWNVDRKRIFTIGLSNGGFMGHRMACDHADLIAGIVSIAGAIEIDPELCHPSQGVHILDVHGTLDTVILFDGGTFTGPYPSALETVQRWVALNECDASEPGPTIDVDTAVPGAETETTRYTGCRPGGSVEFWEMVGSGHYLFPTDDFRRIVADYFFSHPKP